MNLTDTRDEDLNIKDHQLVVEQVRTAVRWYGNFPHMGKVERMSYDYDNEHAVALVSWLATLPEKGKLSVYATWKDGLRDVIYGWLPRKANKWYYPGWLFDWVRTKAGSRWPAVYNNYEAIFFLPDVEIPPHLTHRGDALRVFGNWDSGHFSLEPNSPVNPPAPFREIVTTSGVSPYVSSMFDENGRRMIPMVVDDNADGTYTTHWRYS